MGYSCIVCNDCKIFCPKLVFKVRKIPSYDGKNLNLLFVGNIRYWHGIERIISSIKNYKGNVNITLNICGDINQEDYLTPLINDNKTNYKIGNE